MQSGFSGQGEPALTTPSMAVVAAVGTSWSHAGSSLLHFAGSVSHRAPGKRAAMSAGRGVIEVFAAPTSTCPPLSAAVVAVAVVEPPADVVVPAAAGLVGRDGSAVGTGLGARPMPAHAAETISEPVRPAMRVERTIVRMRAPGKWRGCGTVSTPQPKTLR